MHNYAPLSAAVSPFLPEQIDVVREGDEIAISELYLRNDIPHLVLTHPRWDTPIHFKIRWVSRKNVRIIALLELADRSFDRTDPAQVFVYVPSNRSVSVVPNRECMKALHSVGRDILSRQHYNSHVARQKFRDDIEFAFGPVVESPPCLKEGTPVIDFVQALKALLK